MTRFSKDDRIEDFRIATAFLTRLPLLFAHAPDSGRLAQAAWAFPVVGFGIGIAGGLVYGAAVWGGLPPLLAAVFAIAAQIAITGALHEDATGDVADGLGGDSRERRLDIMRDSHVGTYGALALFVAVGARVAAVSALGDTGVVIVLLAAAGALSRAAMAAIMAIVPPARSDGLSHHAGQPERPVVVAALGIAAGLGFLALAVPAGVAGFVAAAMGAALGAGGIALLARRKFGGQTGDVLGACQQAAEVLCLSAVVAVL